MIDRRTALATGAALIAGGGIAHAQTPPPLVPGGRIAPGLSQPDATIDLWPAGTLRLPSPPPVELVTDRSTDASYNDRAVAGITRPRLAVFRPARPSGAAILLFPGGGYVREAIDKEGYELARLLAGRGVTAFVLFYRLPGEGWAGRADVPLADAQRAMRLVRAQAGAYDIEPTRVAAMGFSAGGHLCADLAARFDARVYAPVDGADRESARPCFAAPIYPVVSMDAAVAHGGSRAALLGPDSSPALEAAHSPDRQVSGRTPPCFLLAAEDDATVPVANTLMLHAALKRAGVPVELHLFAAGGHGFGLRGAAGKPVAVWPDLFWHWAQTQGWA
jgi:acetyl esterase/lipase